MEVFMRYQSKILLALLATLSLTLGAAGGSDKEKDQLKLAVDDLKNEVTILERQVSTMQQSMDRNSGQMSALITQISDTVNSIRSAQSRVSQGYESVINTANATGEQIGSANQKIETNCDNWSRTCPSCLRSRRSRPVIPTSSLRPGSRTIIAGAMIWL
jgi:outer membrane murein-binding lipoprotein Lpp